MKKVLSGILASLLMLGALTIGAQPAAAAGPRLYNDSASEGGVSYKYSESPFSQGLLSPGGVAPATRTITQVGISGSCSATVYRNSGGSWVAVASITKQSSPSVVWRSFSTYAGGLKQNVKFKIYC